MTTAIRVFIVDDQFLARGAIRSLLELAPDIKVVGEAPNGQEAVQAVKGDPPDLVLMDIDMPVMDGVSATRAILRDRPQARVMMLTSHDEEDNLQHALAAGAMGFLTKSAPALELHQAVREVAGGGSHIDQGIMARLGERLAALSLAARQTMSRRPFIYALLLAFAALTLLAFVTFQANDGVTQEVTHDRARQLEINPSSNR